MKAVKLMLIGSVAAGGLLMAAVPAKAQSEPLIGQLLPFGGNFCPRGYAETNGQLLPIAQNQALFSILGTTYGGDGRTTFGLPDLRGRTPIHQGSGPGLPSYSLGQKGGTTTFTLLTSNMPAHNHAAGVQTANGQANTIDPRLAAFARVTEVNDGYLSGGTPSGRFMAENTVVLGNTGGGQAVNKVSPFQVIQWCIALQGIFPSRN